MYLHVLEDSRLPTLLLQVDRDLAEQTRQGGCRFCRGPLHSACYSRRPRGLPARSPDAQLPADFDVAFSFCCSADGCRRRHRTPSVRFLGPKVYLGVVVALVTAMRQGPTPRTVRQLTHRFGVDRRTLGRWRAWWQRRWPRTDLWRRAAGRFMPPVHESDLPRSLISRFTGDDAIEQVLRLMRLLAGADCLPRGQAI